MSVISLLACTARAATTTYDNTSTDLGVNFNPGALEVGDEITLAPGTPRFVTQFTFQYYLLSPTGAEQARIRFYKNDGAPNIDSTQNPSTVLFDSGSFAITGTSRSTLIFDQTALGGGVFVPDDFTWSVQFTGLGGGDDAGVTLYNPPTVGTDTHDYWLDNGGTWTLMTNSVNPINFAAQVQATPEPSSIALFGFAAAGLVGMLFKRRQNRQ